jgi:hypothetical protein
MVYLEVGPAWHILQARIMDDVMDQDGRKVP